MGQRQATPDVCRWALTRPSLLAIGLALTCLSLWVVVANAAGPSPQALYRLLLTRPFPDSALPQGFSSAKIFAHAEAKTERKQDRALRVHFVGGVGVDMQGGDAFDAVEYSIWESAGDAKRVVLAPPEQHPGDHLTRIGRVPGYTAPSALIEGSSTGKNAAGKTVTVGETFAGVVVGNVIVGAVTISAHSTTRGNRPAALSLLRAGIKHLRAVPVQR